MLKGLLSLEQQPTELPPMMYVRAPDTHPRCQCFKTPAHGPGKGDHWVVH